MSSILFFTACLLALLAIDFCVKSMIYRDDNKENWETMNDDPFLINSDDELLEDLLYGEM
jgi:hypothetical protein